MKIQKKIFITITLMVSILFVLLTIPNYAVNETNNTNVQNSTSTSTTNTTTTKSSNANLSNLGITPHDFTGFKSGTTSYEVVVPEETETVEVYAKTQDTKATVTGTGKKTLEKGENKVEVVVTAEDGTKKTYTINIIREVKQEGNIEAGKEASNIENGNGLVELKVNDLSLLPEFKTDVYEYTVKYIGEDTKLKIEAKPTNENYIVEVIGNNDLQEGENIITILVSESNGDNVATYQVTVNKSLVDEEAIAKEKAEQKERQQKIILVTIVGIILIAIIVFIVVRHRKNKNLAEEFSGAYFYDDYNNEKEDDEEEGEIPRALKKEKNQERDRQEEYDEDEIEKMPKEALKEKFLNNYSNYEEEYGVEEKEIKRKGKHKGKRFK